MATKIRKPKPEIVTDPYCGVCGSCGEDLCCHPEGCGEIQFIKSTACLYPDSYLQSFIRQINTHTKVPKAQVEKVLIYLRDKHVAITD